MDDWDDHLEHHEVLEDGDDSSDANSRRGGNKRKVLRRKRMHEETRRETAFHSSSKICLELIREAMLHHRWQEAAEYMASYPQILVVRSKTRPEHVELIWKLSTEILHHHPKSTMEDNNIIYERMKHSGVKYYLKICLEHAFHLMLHGQFEDAKQRLCAAESWRYGKTSAAQFQRTKLIQAYRSLLDYIIWSEKTSASSSSNNFDSDHQNMHYCFRQASVNFKEILRNPGVWDPFILSYVAMLEFYDDQTEALNVLNEYAFDSSFPPNPNAYVYLFQYLKRHDAPQKKLIQVLMSLHRLVPSHELMLEYSSLLLHSEEKMNIRKALGVVLEMLDFACWRSNLDVWKRLQAIIHKLQIEDHWETVVCDEMASRKDWWPALHFTKFHASRDSTENHELLQVKASLIKILCPDRTLKYGAEENRPD
ncbi:unnamed protein product [Menidia menidia]|uniref:(Atlantic silverside) hypothetical protein n=1 Tax=Menidia menidia TaxID=238744 RepID=A0A8S4B3W7_9TELE|nr:unnamed protein product [Menidia menidia]